MYIIYFFAAFTIFSACEYLIAVANILFHFTAVHEFGEASWCLLDVPVYCGKDAICPVSSNGPTFNRRMMSVKDYEPMFNRRMMSEKDYDNNDRKKLC